MRLSRYSASEWHERQHQTARGLMAAITEAARERGAIFQVLDAISGWLFDLIAVADKMLGAHLRNCQRTLNSAPSRERESPELPTPKIVRSGASITVLKRNNFE